MGGGVVAALGAGFDHGDIELVLRFQGRNIRVKRKSGVALMLKR